MAKKKAARKTAAKAAQKRRPRSKRGDIFKGLEYAAKYRLMAKGMPKGQTRSGVVDTAKAFVKDAAIFRSAAARDGETLPRRR